MTWPVFIDTADLERMKLFHELRRKSPAEAPQSYECRFRTRTGEVRDMFITVALIPGTGESVASLMDITDRKRAEEELLKSEQRYRNIMDSIKEAYYEVDLQGNFTFFNTMAWLALGYAEDELRNMNFHAYLDEKTAGEVYATFNRVFVTGEPVQAFEFEAITPGGRSSPWRPPSPCAGTPPARSLASRGLYGTRAAAESQRGP
jgi:PAS domain S-box-containing protein